MRVGTCIAAAALGLLAACAPIQMQKVDRGQVTIGDALTLTADMAWNRFELQFPLSVAPGATQIWTQDGITLDALAFFVGVADGQTLGAQLRGSQKTLPLFRADMTPDEIVDLYEQAVTQEGSRFALERVAPARFGGYPGFRIEYTITRKSDSVLLKGVALGAVVKGKLHLAAFTAPAIYYYGRYLPQVEPLLASAQIK